MLVLIIASGASAASVVAAIAQAAASQAVEGRVGIIALPLIQPHEIRGLHRLEADILDGFRARHLQIIEETRAKWVPEPSPKEALEYIGRYGCVDYCGAILKAKGQVCPRCARTRAKRHNYHQRKWKK